MRYSTLEELRELSPSKHEMDWKAETFRKSILYAFLCDLAAHVGAQQLAISTAAWYMHRYYRRHAIRGADFSQDRYIVATACLFLASKVEEAWIPMSRFVPVAFALRFFYMQGRYHDLQHKKNIVPSLAAQVSGDAKRCAEMRAGIGNAEGALLHTLGFDIEQTHATSCANHFIEGAVRSARANTVVEKVGLEQSEILFDHLKLDVILMINQSMETPLCLQFDPRTIACGVILYAMRKRHEFLDTLKMSTRELTEVLKLDLRDVAEVMKQTDAFCAELRKRAADDDRKREEDRQARAAKERMHGIGSKRGRQPDGLRPSASEGDVRTLPSHPTAKRIRVDVKAEASMLKSSPPDDDDCEEGEISCDIDVFEGGDSCNKLGPVLGTEKSPETVVGGSSPEEAAAAAAAASAGPKAVANALVESSAAREAQTG